jgi:hypothetical protein
MDAPAKAGGAIMLLVAAGAGPSSRGASVAAAARLGTGREVAGEEESAAPCSGMMGVNTMSLERITGEGNRSSSRMMDQLNAKPTAMSAAWTASETVQGPSRRRPGECGVVEVGAVKRVRLRLQSIRDMQPESAIGGERAA